MNYTKTVKLTPERISPKTSISFVQAVRTAPQQLLLPPVRLSNEAFKRHYTIYIRKATATRSVYGAYVTSLLQSFARGRSINEKKTSSEVTNKNCASEIPEGSSMTFASALCNAGLKS